MKTQKETSLPIVHNNNTAQFNAQVLKRVGANRDGVLVISDAPATRLILKKI